MKSKVLLLILASISISIFSLKAMMPEEGYDLAKQKANEDAAYAQWLSTNPKTAQEWEDASFDLAQAAYPSFFKNTEKGQLPTAGKYGASLLTGLMHSYKAALEPVITTGQQLVDALQAKIDNTVAQGNTLSTSGYKALQTALYLAIPTTAFVVSGPTAIAGLAYGLGSHLGLDIVDLFRAAKAKLSNNSLTSEEAAQLAQEIQETTQELEEQIATLQKKLALKRLASAS